MDCCVCVCAAPPPQADFKDWWWKARLGKCYYQLGLYRDAERQFKSANKEQTMVVTTLELCKVQQLHNFVHSSSPALAKALTNAIAAYCCQVYIKLDQPNTAIEAYEAASQDHPGDVTLLLGIARVHDMLNDVSQGVSLWKKVQRMLGFALDFDSLVVFGHASLSTHPSTPTVSLPPQHTHRSWTLMRQT